MSLMRPTRNIEKLIGVAGLSGSGKTTLTKALSARLKVPYYAFGDFIRARAASADLQTFGQNYVTDRGASGFVEDFLAFYKVEAVSACIVEGIRHPDVWRELVARSGASLLIFLAPPPSVINRRLRERGGKSGRDPAAQLAHPVEEGVPDVQRLADLVLDEIRLDFVADLVLERVITALGITSK